MSVLDEILATKRDEVTMLRRPAVRDLLRREALAAPRTRPFAAALRDADGHLAVIAEFKRRSPSKGDLGVDLDVTTTTTAYAAGGASALSVLTDGPYFGGAVADLQAARAAAGLPILRKDFIIDEVQVYEARAIGADAILLIVTALPDDGLLRDLHDLATALGLAVLVETHDGAELDRALALGAAIIGVNARNLGTFAEDLDGSAGLAARIPATVIAVAESALRTPEDARRMAAVGYDAVLAGEAFVRAAAPDQLIRAFRSATVAPRPTS
jgi:indole-3-glycerol phosphate synthase